MIDTRGPFLLLHEHHEQEIYVRETEITCIRPLREFNHPKQKSMIYVQGGYGHAVIEEPQDILETICMREGG